MTALKRWSFRKSSNAMASCCCRSVERSFLEGQLMLSTVATHAPRNSRGTAGRSARKGSSTTSFLGSSSVLGIAGGRTATGPGFPLSGSSLFGGGNFAVRGTDTSAGLLTGFFSSDPQENNSPAKTATKTVLFLTMTKMVFMMIMIFVRWPQGPTSWPCF